MSPDAALLAALDEALAADDDEAAYGLLSVTFDEDEGEVIEGRPNPLLRRLDPGHPGISPG